MMAKSLSSANRNPIAAQSDGLQPKMGVSEIQEIAKKLFKLHTHNIEVIEDTILIDASISQKHRKFHNKNKKQKKQQRKRYVVKKQVYSRDELEALRFHDLDAQQNKWAAVYAALGPVVAAEYDGLVAFSGFDRRQDFDPKAAMGRRNYRNIYVH